MAGGLFLRPCSGRDSQVYRLRAGCDLRPPLLLCRCLIEDGKPPDLTLKRRRAHDLTLKRVRPTIRQIAVLDSEQPPHSRTHPVWWVRAVSDFADRGRPAGLGREITTYNERSARAPLKPRRFGGCGAPRNLPRNTGAQCSKKGWAAFVRRKHRHGEKRRSAHHRCLRPRGRHRPCRASRWRA
jgi:hypothetical protein